MLTDEALHALLPQAATSPLLNVYSLRDYGVIQVSGPDWEKFLQGQLTCDCRNLALQQVVLGAHCTPKGRMISSFWAAQSPAGIWLQVHGSVLEAQFTALKKYSVFSKVQVCCPSGLSGVAIQGQGAQRVVGERWPNIPSLGHSGWLEGVLWCVLGPDLIYAWGEAAALTAALGQLAQALPMAMAQNFQAHLVAMGWAEVRAETSEHFIPQELNIHLREGVSFKKGCYTGQEIVARMQYLGKQKKHLYHGRVQVPNAGITPAMGVYVADKPDAHGEVVNVSYQGDECHFLAVVNDAAIDGGAVFFKALPDAKISWQALPYAIP